jgi:CRP-like cAMP-binding protein
LHGPRLNRLLAALPISVYARMLPELSITPLPLGWTVYEANSPLEYVYFPTTGIISMLHVMKNGASAEIALVGNDGVVGVAAFMGGSHILNRGVVQNAGHAYVLRANLLMDEFRRGGLCQQLLLHYTQALMTQMTQTAVCNRLHSLAQQFSRWLLLSLDRAPSSDLLMTEMLIADMLGIDLEGAKKVLDEMQRAGLIEHTRGHVVVPDRKALEAHSCECYAVVRKEFDRLLPDKTTGELRTPGAPR